MSELYGAGDVSVSVEEILPDALPDFPVLLQLEYR
jgi:hypothetical protein